MIVLEGVTGSRRTGAVRNPARSPTSSPSRSPEVFGVEGGHADRTAAPVRVVVVDHTARTGGAELALLRVCRVLDPARVDLTVVLFEDGPLVGLLREAGVRVRVLPLDRRVAATDRFAAGRWSAVRAGVRTVPFVGRLVALLRELDPQVVHTTSLKADVLGLVAGRLVGRPVVWHVHDRVSEDYLPRAVARVLRALARRGPAHVVVNSAATAGTLTPLPHGWTLASPGLGVEQVVADPVRAPVDPPVVALVGRISPTKGQLVFVEACALLAARYPRVRFRVVGAALFGERDYERQVRERIEQLGLTDRVELTGWTSAPAAEMDRLSVLVHASPVPEPFGQVVLEAMARAVPVVATAGGGVDELARQADGSARCTVVPPGDPAALAAAVGALLDDPAGAAQRARLAWADVRTEHPVQVTADRIIGVWEQVARRARG